MRKTIFIILSRIPYPLEKGDKLRAFYQIRELAKRHDLIICALSDNAPHPEASRILGQYAKSIYFFRLQKAGIFKRLVLAMFASRPFQVAYFHSGAIQKKVDALLATHKPDHIFCQLIRAAEYVRHTGIDKTIDYQDVFSAGLHRRLSYASWFMRPLLRSEYHRVARYEQQVFDDFDKKVIISFPDRDKIPHEQRDAITVVPNGVDTGFFTPLNKEKTFDILFTGNMAYPPNVNGAEYLVHEIMPEVWKSMPGATAAIAGASPTAAVRALASSRVTVTGWVDDIRDYYAGSRVFIAPMRIGTGLQNKVLEAMAMQMPCITSSLANSALRAKPGEEILIGENAGEYARHVVSLLQNSTLRQQVADSGYQFVLDNFNWESTSKTLEQVITDS